MQFLDNRVKFLYLNFVICMGEMLLQFSHINKNLCIEISDSCRETAFLIPSGIFEPPDRIITLIQLQRSLLIFQHTFSVVTQVESFIFSAKMIHVIQVGHVWLIIFRHSFGIPASNLPFLFCCLTSASCTAWLQRCLCLVVCLRLQGVRVELASC